MLLKNYLEMIDPFLIITFSEKKKPKNIAMYPNILLGNSG